MIDACGLQAFFFVTDAPIQHSAAAF